jgi:hypothetical protein
VADSSPALSSVELSPMNNHLKTALDWASIGTAVLTLSQYLPSIAALFTIVWTAIRIFETATVKGWLAALKNAARGDL